MRTAIALATTLALASPAFASTWDIDPTHTDVGFSVKHMMVSNTKGRFAGVKGTVDIDDKDLTKTKIGITIDVKSIDTREPKRDDHLRSPDFFDVAKFPTLTFKSKSVATAGKGFKVTGDITIHGVTKEIVLDVDSITAPLKDPFGGTRRGVVAHTKVNRGDFGLKWNKAIEAGGVVVGEEVTITIDAELTEKK